MWVYPYLFSVLSIFLVFTEGNCVRARARWFSFGSLVCWKYSVRPFHANFFNYPISSYNKACWLGGLTSSQEMRGDATDTDAICEPIVHLAGSIIHCYIGLINWKMAGNRPSHLLIWGCKLYESAYFMSLRLL